jgi:hypothetical protein
MWTSNTLCSWAGILVQDLQGNLHLFHNIWVLSWKDLQVGTTWPLGTARIWREVGCLQRHQLKLWVETPPCGWASSQHGGGIPSWSQKGARVEVHGLIITLALQAIYHFLCILSVEARKEFFLGSRRENIVLQLSGGMSTWHSEKTLQWDVS